MKPIGILTLIAVILASTPSYAGTAQCEVLYFTNQPSDYHLNPAFIFEFDSTKGVYEVLLYQAPTSKLLASVTEFKGKLRLSIEKDLRPRHKSSVSATGEFDKIGAGPIYFDQNEVDGENIHINCARIN